MTLTAVLVPVLAALAVPAAVPAQAGAAHTVAAAAAAVDPLVLPDPTQRGSYTPTTIQETKLGLASLQEPNSAGDPATTGTLQAPANLEIRGSLYYPADRAQPSPLIVLVHGNHGSCDAGSDVATATCTTYKRNEAGYAYLGENLATWGYTVFSLSQDQLILRQDSAKGKGMHQRRLLIAATLDAFTKANTTAGLPTDANTTLGTTLSGKLDMTRIGLMGHSRGGDGVTSFIDYNRIRTDGPRYPLRGVISLAPTDYERKAPTGVPYMTILPFCDGDVSNLQGARFFERSQYIDGDDPFPHIQSSQLGAIHNWYNTVWYADGAADGQANNDAACGNSAPFATTNIHPHNLRLSGAASYTDPALNYAIDNSAKDDPTKNTRISGDAARMGDQEKIGLATMAAFFRRYVGGEGAFDPYMTGELSDTAGHLQIPPTACPTSESGTRIACKERVSTSYVPPAAERVDLIRPEVENPLTLDALGDTLSGSGFAYPYVDNGGVALPAATPGGYDWCNPEPDDFAPSQLGKSTQPTAAKACPLPGKAALGGQNGTRENSPINHSYGRQLALAWEPNQTAQLTADIPAASSDMSGLKALAMGADVNFFDLRNPGADNRGDSGTATAPNFANELPTSYDPESTTQDFLISLTDTEGNVATVHAGDQRWGNALHMSTGTNTPNTHIVLDQIRVPLTAFEGVDISSLAKLTLSFGAAGTPTSGSIQLADVRFQEAAVAQPLILSDGYAANGPGVGPPATGPDPAAVLASYSSAPGTVKLKDTVAQPYNDTTWTVDDDRAQCPNANFTSIQKAVDFAAPWDTIVVCDGTYQESSTPVAGPGNPVATDARNGLTITKPLKIKGAGADKVTIMPDQSLTTLAGQVPYLRDGGGNVITVSRQSLGSTDTNEMFVDISGVTVRSGTTFAEAGIAFFGAAGRVSESVVGPMRVPADASELADNPRGWGIVKTGFIQGSGTGTVENEVTVANSVVTGYQSGGILFDGARGPDGRAAGTTRTGIEQHGYVTGTVVRGNPTGTVFPQTGVKYTSGADGFVRTSRITGNYFRPDPSQSYGVLLTDARTEATGALTISGSTITNNGWAVYNANADNTAVRSGGPVTVSTSYLGIGTPTPGMVSDPATGSEGISGPDTTVTPNAATVTVATQQSAPSAAVPTTYGQIVDLAPTAALVDPAGGTEVAVGETLTPVVVGRDDLAVRSAALLVDGRQVAVSTTAPYVFTWAPTVADAGKEVVLSSVVTDSAGHTKTSAGVTVSVPATPVSTTPTGPTGPTGPTTSTGATASVPPVPVPPGVTVTDVVRKRNGTARVTLTVTSPGVVSLTGGKVKTSTASTVGTTLTLKVKALGKYDGVLDRHDRLPVALVIALATPQGLTANTTTKVVLRRS